MHPRSILRTLAFFILIASPSQAKDVYLTIAGSVGNFRTDTRIFNPSGSKDITITATFLPAAGNPNPSVVTRTVAVRKREMVVQNDVVSSLFNASGLGGIRLTSDDDFVATQRIYAALDAGTLGQFVPGLDVTAARLKGVVIQLKSSGTGPGTFRTNIGLVNPNNAVANVTLRLYDKNSARVGQPKVEVMQPFAVIPPREVAGYMSAPAGSDLSDAWVSYVSDQPIFAYGSVIDNGTTDPTYVPAFEDSGSSPEPQPKVKTFDIVARQWAFIATPADLRVAKGDRVTLRLTSADVDHGFALDFYMNGDVTLRSGTITELTFEATKEGTFPFFCTISACGEGHIGMSGQLIVGAESPDPPDGY